MKLSDIMGAAHLALYAEVALVLFFAAFAVVLLRAVWPGQGATWDELGRLPLDGEASADHERSQS